MPAPAQAGAAAEGRKPPPPAKQEQQHRKQQQQQQQRQPAPRPPPPLPPPQYPLPTPEEAQQRGISLEGLLSIRHQQLVRRVKAAAGEHRRRLPLYCERYRAGESMLQLAKEVDYPPYLLARMMVEVGALFKEMRRWDWTAGMLPHSHVSSLAPKHNPSHHRSCASSPPVARSPS